MCVLAVLLLSLGSAAYSQVVAPPAADPIPVREVLPGNVVPLHYDLRVLYSDDMLDTVARHVGSLQAADQIGLLNDVTALGFAGVSTAGTILKVATQLPAEANTVVWRRVIGILTGLDDHYIDSPRRLAYRHFALATLSPLAARLGTGAKLDEAANDVILRSTLEQAEGQFGDAATLNEARRVLDSHAGTPGEQRAALHIVAARADAATFDMLLSHAQATADHLEKLNVLYAFAAVDDQALARRMLELALSDEAPAGSAPGLIGSVVAGHSADPQRITDLEAYEMRDVPMDARKPFLAAVASIPENERIVENVLPQIDAWIAAQQPAPTAQAGLKAGT